MPIPAQRASKLPLSVRGILLLLAIGAAISWIAAIVMTVDAPAAAPAPAHDKLPTQPVVPANDKRKYRQLVLDNALEVLLISDPTTEVASAAVDVKVGSWADPTEYQGLAHFLEHMLFMGTEKYPDENGYSEYLSSHGGGSNAYTDSEDTNYFFQIDSRFLPEALDRFAQFFIAPLLNPDGAAREMHAVDSEHRKNLQSDGWRLFQLLKDMSDPASKFHGFGTGDNSTLNKPGVVDALKAFHKRYYSANRMKLVVFGKETLAELEQLVTPMFSAVPNTNAPGPAVVGNPYPTAYLARQVSVAPVQQMQELTLYWPLPSVWGDYRTLPTGYITSTLGHEGDGSLLSYLVSKGWADGVSAGLEVDGVGFALFEVTVSLTQTVGNDQAVVNQVIAAVYAYLNMLRQPGNIAKRIWTEMQQLDEIHFRFAEPSPASDTTSGLARRMQRVPAALLLNPPSYWQWSQSLVEEMLTHLVPGNMLVFFTSSAIPVASLPQSEPIYGTKYTTQHLGDVELRAWQSVTLGDALHLPDPNAFIPTSFDILAPPPAGVASNSTPQLVLNADDKTTWWLQDVMFQLPRINLESQMTSFLPKQSADNAIATALYIEAVQEALRSTAYAAGLAGFGYSLSPSGFSPGLTLSVSGYSDKFEHWVETVVRAMEQPAAPQALFDVWRDNMVQALENLSDQQPYRISLEWLRTFTKQTRFQTSELLAAARRASRTELLAYIPQFRQHLAFETLVHGNADRAQSLTLAALVPGILNGGTGLPKSEAYRRQAAKLPAGSHVYQRPGPNADNVNSATVVTFQMGLRDRCNAAAVAAAKAATKAAPMALQEDCIKSSLAVDLLGSYLQEPAFNELRTKQQLGYVVFAWASSESTSGNTGTVATPQYWADAVRSLNVLVQGSSHSATYFDDRIGEFLANVTNAVPESTWADVVSSMIVTKTKKPLTLATLTGTVWGEIAGHTYQFTRHQQEAALLPQITYASAVARLQAAVLTPGSGERRRLSVELFGAGQAIEAPQGPAAATVIADMNNFIGGLQTWE